MKEGANVAGNEITLQATFLVGGQSNRVQAQQESQQFMHPSVFEYRSAIFPNPKNFRLRIKPVSATVKAWPPPPPSPLNTMYIEYVVQITGVENQIRAWTAGVERALKAYAPAAYGSTSERASHLAKTGRKAAGSGVAIPHDGLGLGGDRAAHLRDRKIAAPHKEGSKT